MIAIRLETFKNSLCAGLSNFIDLHSTIYAFFANVIVAQNLFFVKYEIESGPKPRSMLHDPPVACSIDHTYTLIRNADYVVELLVNLRSYLWLYGNLAATSSPLVFYGVYTTI